VTTRRMRWPITSARSRATISWLRWRKCSILGILGAGLGRRSHDLNSGAKADIAGV
jgi:hypothetical protein